MPPAVPSCPADLSRAAPRPCPASLPPAPSESPGSLSPRRRPGPRANPPGRQSSHLGRSGQLRDRRRCSAPPAGGAALGAGWGRGGAGPLVPPPPSASAHTRQKNAAGPGRRGALSAVHRGKDGREVHAWLLSRRWRGHPQVITVQGSWGPRRRPGGICLVSPGPELSLRKAEGERDEELTRSVVYIEPQPSPSHRESPFWGCAAVGLHRVCAEPELHVGPSRKSLPFKEKNMSQEAES